jgi:hypothetical protein
MGCESTCSALESSQLLQGGAKKKRPLNAWMVLLLRLKKENPDKSLKEVMKIAKKEYAKEKGTSTTVSKKKSVKKSSKKSVKKSSKK